jgi:hypothetical protein
MSERVFKIGTILLSIIVIPTFGWVWTTDRNLTRFEVQAESRLVVLESQSLETDEKIDELEDASGKLLLIQRDIEYIKQTLAEIKESMR